MNRERDEADQRLALASLRRRDEALPRPFAMMWSAAERNVAAGTPSARSYRWIAAGALAALILAVTLVERSAPPHVDDPLSAWRSPTDFLLASDPELWRGTPRFGLPADYSITFPDQEI